MILDIEQTKTCQKYLEIINKLNLLYGPNDFQISKNSNLIYLTFTFPFDKSIGNLPEGITHLIINSHKFNKPIGILPNSIQHIYIGSFYWNQPIVNLPEQIKSIQFEKNVKFNQSVNNLPKYLEKIIFPHEFSQSVNNLPGNIKYIEFGCNFNNPIDFLPNSVEHIILNKKFSHPIMFLPKNLKILEFVVDSIFNHPIDLIDFSNCTNLIKIIFPNLFYFLFFHTI